MSRIIGVASFVLVLYGVLIWYFPNARSIGNHQDMARYFGYYGILSLGVGTLIIAGGIDLSIGSLVGLCAILFGLLLEREVSPWLAASMIIGVAVTAGLWHGLLVTKLGLQPFLVTLCGLFIYRGLAVWFSKSSSVGLGVDAPEEYKAEVQQLVGLLVKVSPLRVPNILFVMLAVAAILAVLLHKTVYGRYLYAIGANEQAARYAGIPTDRYKILSYVISSACAGLGGILFLCEKQTAQPTQAGSLDELYAITGAVLGGCSLKGGVGSVLGMVLGAMVLPLLRNVCDFSPIGSDLVYAVTGVALLIGTIVNELIARRRP
jgi:ribose transport system permease protein